MHDGKQTRSVNIPADQHAHHQIIGMGTSNGRDWLVTSNGEVLCWDIKTADFMRLDTQLAGKIMQKDRVIISPSKNSDFWLMWDNGIAYYDFLQSKWSIPQNAGIDPQDIYTCISADAEGNAWVGTGTNGVYYIDPRTMNALHYASIPMIDGKSVNNDITNICINRNTGDVWIAFIFRGLAFGNANINMFNHHGNQTNDSSARQTRSMAIGTDGKIMLGTLDGLRRYDPATGIIDVPIPELSREKCKCIFTDSKGRLWIGTLYNGIFLTDGQKILHHYYNPEVPYHVFNTELSPNSILAINEDAQGDIWVSVRGGLCKLDQTSGELISMRSTYPDLNHYITINSIYTDPDSCVLLGSTDGYCVFKPGKGVRLESRKITVFSTCDFYNHIYRDSRGLLWLGTQNGLQVVDREQRTMHPITLNEGLSNSAIKCIVEDQLRNIWVSTSHGIDRIEVTHVGDNYEFRVRPYTESDGLLAGEYYAGSGVVAQDGTIYFGGLDGFTSFNPAKFAFNTTENQPIITGLQIANNMVSPGEKIGGKVILENSISETQSIRLDHDQNFITIYFSGLNYANPEQTSYRYRLVGLDDEWTEESFTNQQGKVSYSNLAPGHYTFEVITANSDKVWSSSPTKLDIYIAHPFYNTVWARILYALILIGLIILINKKIKRKNMAKIERIRQSEALKQKEELDQMKFKFFTNVSHEFRTPLTLIITPLQSLIKKMGDSEEKERLKSIHRNATQLLELVNQLLDFRKVEMKGSKLKLKNGNIKDLVTTTTNSFHDVAAEKGIGLTLETENITQPYMALDSGKLHKILNNLLSNALKYTQPGGNVTVSAKNITVQERKYIAISVSDTGIGIPAKDIDHVFDRFFQASNNHTEGKGSSGVGLHLIKELTEMHHGKVDVVSTEGQGTTFTVTIPADLHATNADAEIKDAPTDTAQSPEDGAPDSKPLVLIVEDNDDFCKYMCEELSSKYHVISASDGQQGEKIAIEKNPDIIISDVMMPIKDGIQMCQSLKQNVQTSHIPVVLLTARANDESRAQGYEAGADSYLTKPFDIDALYARIRKLIEQKQQRQAAFRKEITVEPSTITITSVDERLVQKALECVEKNMDNTEYAVDELCADMAMTRATLYRKMQGITGQTPKDFIRTIRIKRAAQLLRDSKLSVSEIGYMTGFSSPRIFSKTFKEVMGVLPSQYTAESSIDS